MYRALAGISPSPASVAAIVYGIKAASQEFRNVSFSHVCRQGNISAHLLVNHAIGNLASLIFLFGKKRILTF